MEGAISFTVVCEFPDFGGRPGPRLTGVMLLLGLAGPVLDPVAVWLWVHGGDWLRVWL